jgi:hypothetical protein
VDTISEHVEKGRNEQIFQRLIIFIFKAKNNTFNYVTKLLMTHA